MKTNETLPKKIEIMGPIEQPIWIWNAGSKNDGSIEGKFNDAITAVSIRQTNKGVYFKFWFLLKNTEIFVSNKSLKFYY